MSDALLDVLRLEVYDHDPQNRIKNHSGQHGDTIGWLAEQGSLESVEATRLRAYPNSSGATRTASPAFPVAPGELVGAVATLERLSAGESEVTIAVRWYGADGLAIGGNVAAGMVPFEAGAQVELQATPRTAPAGAVAARVVFTGQHSPASPYDLRGVMVVVSSDLGEAATATFHPERYGWRDLLPSGLEVKLNRGAEVDGVLDKLVAGMLEATVTDPAVDPAVDPSLRPGVVARFMGRSGASWATLGTARVVSTHTTYDHDRTRVRITAADVHATLANTPQPYAYSGNLTQRVAQLLEGSGVASVVVDSALPVTPQVLVAVTENASALDQVQIARDTLRGQVWVDRYNRLAGRTNVNAGTWHGVLSDTYADAGAVYYHGIEASYDSALLVNALTVNRQNVDEAEGEGTKVYGPYLNDASVQEWGASSAEVTINGGAAVDAAGYFLARYPTPLRRVESVTFDGAANPAVACAVELYDRVDVAHRGVRQTWRIIGVEHQVTPTTWDVTLRLRPLEAASSVAVTSPVAGPATGPGDAVAYAGAYAARYRSTNFSLATATETTIPFETLEVANGITYDAATSSFVIDRAGRYLVHAAITYAAHATGARQVRILVGGGTAGVGTVTGTAGMNTTVFAARTLKLAEGARVSVAGYQASGGALNVIGGGSRWTFVDITFLGE